MSSLMAADIAITKYIQKRPVFGSFSDYHNVRFLSAAMLVVSKLLICQVILRLCCTIGIHRCGITTGVKLKRGSKKRGWKSVLENQLQSHKIKSIV